MKLLSCLFLIFHLSVVVWAADQDPPFDRKEARARLFAVIENPPVTELKIKGFSKASAKNKRLVLFYRDQIWKSIDLYERGNITVVALRVAIDTGLYDSPEELAQWQQRMQDAYRSMQETQNQRVSLKLLTEAKVLVKGLRGNLASSIRQWIKANDTLDAQKEKQVQEIDQLESEAYRLSQWVNQKSIELHEHDRQIESSREVNRKYKAGEISYDQAAEYFGERVLRYEYEFGQRIIEEAGGQLNQIGVLRTQIAKKLGYRTWSDYAVAQQSDRYSSAQLRSVAGRRKLLTRALQKSEPIYRKLVAELVRSAGITKKVEELRTSEWMLLKPMTAPDFYKYFPKERAEEIWTQTMQKSGFDFKNQTIYMDNYPRAGKTPNAYATSVSTKKARSLTLDAVDLSMPTINQPNLEASHPEIVYIVQNFDADGLNPLELIFHEGGHGLHAVHRNGTELHGPAFAETQSLLMEKFLEDREFLLAVGKTRNGEAIPEELVDRYLAIKVVNNIETFRAIAAQALFELELWDYDYEKGGESFAERGTRLYAQAMGDSSLMDYSPVKGVSPGTAFVISDHFYSGRAEYIGYLLGEIAAQMTYQGLLDYFDWNTDRRSIYDQPELARLLVEGYYLQGSNQPFPKAIEDALIKRFRPIEFLGLQYARINCGELLQKIKD